MDKIGIGFLVGLLIVIISLIAKSELFSPLQKRISILLCILFFPIGLLITLIFFVVNKYQLSINKNNPYKNIQHQNSSNFSNENISEPQPKSKSTKTLKKTTTTSETESTTTSQSTKDDKSQIHKLKSKLELLTNSFENDIISKQQFESKTSEIKKQIIEEELRLQQKIEEAKINELNAFIEEKLASKINQLNELLNEDLISQQEYDTKKEWLIIEAKKEFEKDKELMNPSNFRIDQNVSTKLFGYRNKENELVIDHKYEDAFPFNEGLAAVIANGKRGYIDYKGDFVINPIYDEGTFFSNGIATVSLNGEKFKINPNGERVN